MPLPEGSVSHGLAPARLARAYVEDLRQLSGAARAKKWYHEGETLLLKLHIDHGDDRKLALVKLGLDAPHVLVRVSIYENCRKTDVYAVRCEDGGSTHVNSHRFQTRASTKEWVRILSRHCRHAFGVLALLGTQQQRVSARASERPPCVESS